MDDEEAAKRNRWYLLFSGEPLVRSITHTRTHPHTHTHTHTFVTGDFFPGYQVFRLKITK